MAIRILGISASLRNARRGKGNELLVEDLLKIPDQSALQAYLKEQSGIHLENFVQAGRQEKKPFNELYRNLSKLGGKRGLSNSETALAAALWAAAELDCEIRHISLSEYFKEDESRTGVELDRLKQELREADGIILSGPVYFGDRGSLAQSLLSLMRSDTALARDLESKVYAGIAVGAKRNGGQETTLIYQLWDMLQSGLLGVGNDSETTSQYGGTGHAGDIGTMHEDSYGIETSLGTGRRIARVTQLMAAGRESVLNAKLNLAFWILQDRDHFAMEHIARWARQLPQDSVDVKIINIAEQNVYRCIACDICPTHVDVDESYRCIIKNKKDDISELHDDLIAADAIVPVYYGCLSRDGVLRNYQKFIERTRYLRRGDYVFSDALVAPLVIEELGSAENMQIRMLTSMLRHHTVAYAPITVYEQGGQFLNEEDAVARIMRFAEVAKVLSEGRIQLNSSDVYLRYNPVGYVYSQKKEKEDETTDRRKRAMDARRNRFEKIRSAAETAKA